ncbi:MAG: thiamine pyrophosphate-binding protein [Hyphomicrobiales bacterium]|nr:thiamine pyrophosphate-binding protein [Hyphomicrobiales bacterium]
MPLIGGAGENAAGLMLALDESETIRPIIAKNEQGAAFMACGYAMFSNKLGVCFATAGPGAFNLISGLCVALTDSYPLLAITGYSTIAWNGRGGLNETSGLNRTPDSQKIFDAMTKANFLVTDIDDVADTLQQAIDIAFDGRPGPVHIAVAEDIADPSIKVSDFRLPTINVRPVEPDPARVTDCADFLVDAIEDGKTIVLLAGFGAIRAGANREVLDFIERYQIPLITTLDGKGIVDESNPLAIGVFADSGHKSAWELFLDADIVIGLGNSFGQHATFDFRGDLFENRKLVHIDIDVNQIDKVYKADKAIIGDARLAISGLADAMSRVGRVTPKSFRAPDFDEQRVIKVTPKLHPGQIVQSISRMLPPRGVVLADAGAHLAWLGYYLELKDGQSFRKPGTYGPMGIGVNGAIGVKFGAMDRPVVAGVGDGSYLMSGFELMTAVEHEIPVIWVIFNDGEFKLAPATRGVPGCRRQPGHDRLGELFPSGVGQQGLSCGGRAREEPASSVVVRQAWTVGSGNGALPR